MIFAYSGLESVLIVIIKQKNVARVSYFFPLKIKEY